MMFATLISRVTLISRFFEIREIKVSRKFHEIGSSLRSCLVTRQAGAYHVFLSKMCRLEVILLPLDGMPETWLSSGLMSHLARRQTSPRWDASRSEDYLSLFWMAGERHYENKAPVFPKNTT